MKTCPQCNTGFEITPEDLEFYDKVSPVFGGKKYSVPPPTLCPDCRQQGRIAHRNERTFYSRVCDLCKKIKISVYEPNAPFVVYCTECWWGDGWNGLDYGVDFDFSRPFFEQWDALNRRVPHLGLLLNRCENSDFCNQTTGLKNCYLCVNSTFSQDCYYCKGLSNSRDCVDCLKVYDCELCYGCVDCHHCFKATSLQNCTNCSESSYLFNCQNCASCFGCAGLRNKKYHWFNEPLKKEEYEKRIKNVPGEQEIKERLEKIKLNIPNPATMNVNCESSLGDNLHDCKNVQQSYDVVGSENMKFCYDLRQVNDNSYDTVSIGNGISFSYDTVSAGIQMTHCLFVNNCWDSISDIYLSNLVVHGSSDCFGCVGLRHAKYAIFNKVYSKEEYEKLAGRIAEHMQKTGEWGQFFPPKHSPFPYNASYAQEYYPLTKEEALKKGFTWSDYEAPAPKVSRVITKELMAKLPSKIEDVPDDIVNWALTCEASGKLYKIIPQELVYYRKNKIPVPHFHPDERHRRRMALRNPRHLWLRNCTKCGAGIQTTYSPDRPEKVYCEECYLKEVY